MNVIVKMHCIDGEEKLWGNQSKIKHIKKSKTTNYFHPSPLPFFHLVYLFILQFILVLSVSPSASSQSVP